MNISPERADVVGSFEHARSARMEKVRAEIARRLKNACSHLSEEEFEVLVDRMTKVQLGGEGRSR